VKSVKRTARMFDDWATPRSPFVVAYSPRSHPDTSTDSSLSSTLRFQFAIPVLWAGNFTPHIAHKYQEPYSEAWKNTRDKRVKRLSLHCWR